MPTILWPNKLPKPLREGHGEEIQSASLATDFGLVNRSRRIYSDNKSRISVSWKFTAAQLWYFRGFHEHALNDGNEYFMCPVYVGGVLEEREVSFNGQSLASLLAGVSHGRLNATLITREGTAMDAATWEVVASYPTPTDYGDALAALELFVNQDGLAPLE